jgi:hypothetical protein
VVTSYHDAFDFLGGITDLGLIVGVQALHRARELLKHTRMGFDDEHLLSVALDLALPMVPCG